MQLARENANTGPGAAALRAWPLGSATRWLALDRLGPFLGGWLLPFALVLYLGLKGGGYDQVVYGQVGIVVWWIVVLGAAVAVVPVSRIGTAAWIGFGLLAAFAAWTALGVGWSGSAERSVAEIGRVTTYLGIFALALVTQGSGRLRRTTTAVGAGIAVVALLALLSRLQPGLFPGATDTAVFLGVPSRLSYPLNYWNGLAAMVAIGIPLVLITASAARSVLVRAMAAAALPVMALAALYTFSRGGAFEVAIALVVLFALHPRRLQLLPTALVASAGSTILIVAATQRNALEHGLGNAAAHSQGDEMLVLVLVVCAGVGLLAAAIALTGRHLMPSRPVVPRRTAIAATAVTLLAAIVVAIAAGLPGYLSDRWQDFKAPGVPGVTGVQRFDSASGNGRYQLWQAAVDANSTDPAVGIGPGTYEYYWTQHRNRPVSVVNAHSLYLETLAELGVVGLLLIVGAIGTPIVVGTVRSLRARGDPDRAALFAAGVAALAAFAAAAAVDWVWQLPAIVAAFLLIAAALLSSGVRRIAARAGRALAPRIVLVVAGLACLIAVGIPLASAQAIRASQDEVHSNDLGAALTDARTAHAIEPYGASASLQEALVLELQGRFPAALAPARSATQEASTNWLTWVILSRLEAENGDAKASVAAYRKAKELNPQSPVFAR
ncbi:MAG: O-antigen ligase family protein [Solirubrobacterales bacterium]